MGGESICPSRCSNGQPVRIDARVAAISSYAFFSSADFHRGVNRAWPLKRRKAALPDACLSHASWLLHTVVPRDDHHVLT